VALVALPPDSQSVWLEVLELHRRRRDAGLALEQYWVNLPFVVIQGYGLTETAPIVTLNHPFHARRGTVGKPIAGVQIRIAADGEVLVRGGNVTSGYYDDPQATRAAFEDGWFHTGDIGAFDAAGHLMIKGRKKEMIVLADGRNVFPKTSSGPC